MKTIINNELIAKFNTYMYNEPRIKYNFKLPEFSNEEIKILRFLNLMENDSFKLTKDCKNLYFKHYSCQGEYILEGNFHRVIDEIINMYLRKV